MRQNLDRWALEWCSKNKRDGETRHLIFHELMPALFHSRKEARRFADLHYGYIRLRKDLKTEPHGWRVPRPVRVLGIEYVTPISHR